MKEKTEEQLEFEKNRNKIRAHTFLEFFKQIFTSKKKDIEKIKVINGSSHFWVKDKKKIKYWRSIVEKQAIFSMQEGSNLNIRITKVIYK
jgi:hypothetical protein